LARVAARLFPGVAYRLREEGNLLYGGAPRPRIGAQGVMVAGTAAGLVDATTGEGIYEAAMSGRLAAEAVAIARRMPKFDAARAYAMSVKGLFHSRLRHRHKLLAFLERRPGRFDVLFEQLAATPKFAALLQHERTDYSASQWLYLYLQAATFALRAVRV
jgi:flavin-dependent dehydrogenase